MMWIFSKKKRSDWMAGLIYSESLIKEGESPYWIYRNMDISDLLINLDFVKGIFDCTTHYTMRVKLL